MEGFLNKMLNRKDTVRDCRKVWMGLGGRGCREGNILKVSNGNVIAVLKGERKDWKEVDDEGERERNIWMYVCMFIWNNNNNNTVIILESRSTGTSRARPIIYRPQRVLK